MYGSLEAVAFIVIISAFRHLICVGAEMAAVVTAVYHHGILVDPPLLQRIHDAAEIPVEGVAAAKIIGVEPFPVSLPRLQIRGRDKSGELLPASVRPLVIGPVILVMRFDMGNHQEKWFLIFILLNIAHRVIRQTVGPVSGKLQLISVLVKDISAVSVGGEFQHIGRHPVVVVTAAPLGRHRNRLIMVLIFIGCQMPFPHVSYPVSGFPQIFSQRLLAGRQGNRIAVAAGLCRIQSRLEHGSGRSADWLGRKSIGKIHRVPAGKLIQPGRYGKRLAVAAQRIRPLLVGKEKYNVLSLFHKLPPILSPHRPSDRQSYISEGK